MNKQYFYLSGIARSGSTLLGSLLNQNPDIHVTPTSPLMDFFCLTEQTLKGFTQQYTFDVDAVCNNFNRNITDVWFQHIDKPYIFDKHRGWPRNLPIIKQFINPNPKVICTYRPTAENIVSFLKLIQKDPNNSVDQDLRKLGKPITLRNRALQLWEHYSSDPYYSLKSGLETNRDCIHIVNYHDLVDTPQIEIDKIYNFLGIPQYNHTFNNVKNTCAEAKDVAWGFKDLHDIRPVIQKTSDDPLSVLGEELFEYFNKFDEELKIG